ncbi:GAF domain-containing protein [bacterium]|nr:GAF domain-containing protein [bacterium]
MITDFNKHIELLTRQLEREKLARTQAESLLEQKSLDLYGTQKKLEEQYLHQQQNNAERELLYEIMIYVLENHSFCDIMTFFVNRIGQMTNWDVGHVYVPTQNEPVRLESQGIWYSSKTDEFADFKELTFNTVFDSGEGLPGRVFLSQMPHWIEDIENDPNFLRAQILKDIKLKSAFAVPIQVGDKLVAIAEFFTLTKTTRDNKMLKIVEMAAMQLGMSLEKQESQEELEKNNVALENTLSNLKQAQAQLVQSEKMAGLGVLAAGVAHEINNPVGFVMSNLCTLNSYVSLYKSLSDKQDKLIDLYRTSSNQLAIQGYLNEIDMLKKKEDLNFVNEDIDILIKESTEGIERVRDIVQGLKSFARLDEADFKDADINEGIESTLKIVWNEIKYKCTLEKKLSPVPLIRCFPGQLNQVFMNLIVNASQAIKEKGTITIETFSDNDSVSVKISDTGHGIAPENLEKIFTPFFTTKPTGKGTGLGLSISYGIIEKHGGTIKVESTVGVGTSFIITLPREGAQNAA